MHNTAARPPLALRVGITGHRWRESHHAANERLDPVTADRVSESLRRVLAAIRGATQAAHRDFGDLFASEPPTLSLVSALAEGADELAAAVAMEPQSGYVLDVIAPYDLATHAARCAPGTPTRTLWDAARARMIIDGVPRADEPEPGQQQARHEATLVETNRRLVWNCDLIIAVWDGLPARGNAGTAQVIERARSDGLPVIHVHAVDPDHIAVLESIEMPSGEQDVWEDIANVVQQLVEPPHMAYTRRTPRASSDGREARDAALSIKRALIEFATEQPPNVTVRQLGARVFTTAQRFLSGTGRTRAIPAAIASIAPPWRTVSAANAMCARRSLTIDPVFRRADYFAYAFGARHRSTFTLILALAPFAVVCAWVGSVVPHERRMFFAVTEVLLLITLIVLFARSRQLRFHEKWLDYRLLAERLRHMGFLWPLARTSPVIRVPSAALVVDPRPAWVNWWFRAVVRAAGVPPIHLTQAAVRALTQQIQHHLVQAQIAYNRETFAVAHRAEHRLHRWPWIPLLMALAAACTHVLEHLHIVALAPSMLTAVTGVSILGPAFGAALHGFAAQAGFQDVRIRTAGSAQQLLQFAQQLQQVQLDVPLASKAVGDLALSVAEMMGEDLAGWRVDYLARPVNPPG